MQYIIRKYLTLLLVFTTMLSSHKLMANDTNIAMGNGFACAIKTDRTVYCWGDENLSATKPPAGQFKQLAATHNHICGLKTDGTISCWGHDGVGEVSPPSGVFTQIDVGSTHGCGLGIDNQVICWGGTAFGKTTVPDTSFIQVSTGENHSCGLTMQNQIKCWGEDIGLVPNGEFSEVIAGSAISCATKKDNSSTCWGYLIHSSEFVKQISADSYSPIRFCTLKDDGNVDCYGPNPNSMQSPSKDNFFDSISASGNMSGGCGILTTGKVECWGSKAQLEILGLPESGITFFAENNESAITPTNQDSTTHSTEPVITPTNQDSTAYPTESVVTQINQNPIANFTLTPQTGETPLTVQMINTSSDTDGHIVSTEWLINDDVFGTPTTTQYTHTFSSIGEHKIKVKVTDDKGAVTTSSEHIVNVIPRNIPPIANFTLTPQTGETPLTVQMTSISSDTDGHIVSTEWLINGNVFVTSTKTQYTHTFSRIGEHKIKVKVTDDKGASTTSLGNIITVINSSTLSQTEIDAARNTGIAEGKNECINNPLDCGLGQFTDEDKISAFNQGKQECINNLEACGITGFTQADLEKARTDGQQYCLGKPQECGFFGETLNYTATRRLEPQVIMAGISPAIVDLNDTEFNVLALVRPGALPIKNVSLDYSEWILPIAMKKLNTLSNGDELWGKNHVFQRGSIPEGKLEIEWGELPGQYKIIATDSKQQHSAVFPTLSSGSFPALEQ